MVSAEKLKELSLEGGREIGENSAKISECLENLQRTLEENYEDLKLPQNPEDFLIRFLRGSKFDVSKAAKQVSQYFKLLRDLKDIHHLLNSKSVHHLFRDGALKVLKERDSKGRMVIQFRLEFVPPSGWADVSSAAFFLLMDYLHRSSVDTQRIGIVFIVDWTSYSWSHFRDLSPSRAMAVTKLTTHALPARIKGVHYLHNPAIFSHLFAVLKPFLPKKLKSRIHFHGWNYESLHEHIEPRILPKYLGGEVSDDECGDDELFSKLVDPYENFIKIHAEIS